MHFLRVPGAQVFVHPHTGEAGAIGSCPAVVNAIIDGLWREYKIDHIDMPATPERVWIAIREHQRRHSL